MQLTRVYVSALAAVLATMFSAALFAQGAANFPSKPITIVLPYTPGANADQEARVYQEGLNAQLKQPVLIDYKPGAGGFIAYGYVARAVPDGHTLAFINSTVTITPALREDIPYDLLRDFAPVVMTTRNIFVLLAARSLPVNTYEEYIAYAKAKPGEVTWSTVGAGGGFHMAGEWLASATGIKLTFVHYKGGSAAEVDLLAGRIHSTPLALALSMPLIKAGKVRVLAILTEERTPMLPGVRTVAEMGIPGYGYPSWLGLAAPAGTPAAIVDKLNAEVVKAINSPRAMKAWEERGSVVVGSTPDAFRKSLVAELAFWKKLVRENNIQAE